MNRVILMGRLTRDPELRRSQSDMAVTRFSLAIDRPVKSGAERSADFIDCVCFGKQAEFVSKYFVKGQMCLVEGRLQIDDWTDKDGNKRKSAQVVVQNVEFTGSKKESGGYSQNENNNNYGGQNSYSGYSAPVTGSSFAEIDDEDGDLPF